MKKLKKLERWVDSTAIGRFFNSWTWSQCLTLGIVGALFVGSVIYILLTK